MSDDPFRYVHRNAAPVIWDIARAIDDLTRRAGGATWIGRGWSPDSEEHATGRALDVIVSPRVGIPANDVERIAGDLLAAWLIRLADDLRIRHIIWRNRIWRRRRRHEGWQQLTGRTSVSDRHDDHLHIYLDDDEGALPVPPPPLVEAPHRKETAMARTISDEDVDAIVAQLLLSDVQANGKTAPLVQHMAEGFVADAAQSRALSDTNARLSAIARQLAEVTAHLDKAGRK